MAKYVHVNRVDGRRGVRESVDIWADVGDDRVVDANVSHYEARCRCGRTWRDRSEPSVVKWAEHHLDTHLTE